MKKALAALMAGALCLSLAAAPVSAASFDQDSTETAGTVFTFDYKNDPTYTVTIPEAVTMEKEGTRMEIKAEDVAYLDGKKISVTIAGTDQFRNQMLLSCTDPEKPTKKYFTRYQFIMDDETVIETTGADTIVGTELASFTENGTVGFTVRPVISFSSSQVAGMVYTGSMTYGIELVDAE